MQQGQTQLEIRRDHRRRQEEVAQLEASWDVTLTKVGRELIRAGNLLKVCRRANKKFFFALFTDAIVYGSETIPGSITHHRT